MFEGTKSHASIDVSDLEKLIKGNEEKIMSSDIKDLALSLCKAQVELEAVKKDSKSYGYNYSDLASVLSVAKPVLMKHGLAVSQLFLDAPDGFVRIKTILMHESGQFITSSFNIAIPEMKGVNVCQRAGAGKSYGRRYALQAILNMASEDNDASSKETVSAKKYAPKAPKKEEVASEPESSEVVKPKRKFKKDKGDGF